MEEPNQISLVSVHFYQIHHNKLATLHPNLKCWFLPVAGVHTASELTVQLVSVSSGKLVPLYQDLKFLSLSLKSTKCKVLCLNLTCENPN